MVSCALFYACYRHDNKYTAPGTQPVGGVLWLDEAALEADPIIFLVRDWEIYRGRLLTPEDLHTDPPAPDQLTFLGQYGGFEGGDLTASPHGSATYRLRILLPSVPRSYTLELPEIYCAYRLYCNGVLMKQMGDPDPATYRAHTGNTKVTLQAAGELELLLAVSDFSYLYSGMVYPPAFGETQAVDTHLSLRYGLRMAAIAAALCIGLISLGIWSMARRRSADAPGQDLTLLYAALCLCFVGYIAYPVVKTLFPGGVGWYYFENLGYCGVFLFIGLIQQRVSGLAGRATNAFVLLSLFVCCCCVLVPFSIPAGLPVMLAYSALLKLHLYAFALFLTASTVHGLVRGTTYDMCLASGMVVFDCALVFDRAFPSFEPILLGWFTELAAAVLVVLVGAMMADHVARQAQHQLVLEAQVAHVSEVLELELAYRPALLEKEQEARAARHDLRHHFLMLRELAAQGDLGALVQYLDEYDLTYLQPGDASYCRHHVVDMLLRLYARRAKDQQVAFTANVQVPEELPVSGVDLCAVISNLLENALEACAFLPQGARWVHIGVVYHCARLSIVVENPFDGWVECRDGRLLSRKRDKVAGVGSTSVHTIAVRYQGSANFYPNLAAGAFHSEVVLVARQSETENTETTPP